LQQNHAAEIFLFSACEKKFFVCDMRVFGRVERIEHGIIAAIDRKIVIFGIDRKKRKYIMTKRENLRIRDPFIFVRDNKYYLLGTTGTDPWIKGSQF